MPEGTVYVGRPGRYGNPYNVTNTRTNAILEKFTAYAETRLTVEPDWLEPLRGKDLACWCREDASCHADVLLRLANA